MATIKDKFLSVLYYYSYISLIFACNPHYMEVLGCLQGHVRFTEGGERSTDDIEILVIQYQTEESQWNNLNTATIGSYMHSELTLYGNKTIWPGRVW